VIPPDVEPHATDHMPQMIAMIEQLIAAGHAYAAEGHVLFSVPSFAAYGQLSPRSSQDIIACRRVVVTPYKEDAAEFCRVAPTPPHGQGASWRSRGSARSGG